MTDAQVLNKYKLLPGQSGIYIGRPSKWRNIYPMKGPDTRDEVCDAHIVFVLGRPGLVKAIRAELPGKSLVCFCAPKRCHGDFLLRLAQEPDEDPLCIARDLIFYPGRTTPVALEVFTAFQRYMELYGDHQQDYYQRKRDQHV